MRACLREVYDILCLLTVNIEWTSGLARWGLELIVAHIGSVLGECLAAQSVPLHQYEKALKLLQGLHGLSSISTRCLLRHQKALDGLWPYTCEEPSAVCTLSSTCHCYNPCWIVLAGRQLSMIRHICWQFCPSVTRLIQT